MPNFDIASLAQAHVTGALLVAFLCAVVAAVRLPKIISSIGQFIDGYRARSHEIEITRRKLDLAERQWESRQSELGREVRRLIAADDRRRQVDPGDGSDR